MTRALRWVDIQGDFDTVEGSTKVEMGGCDHIVCIERLLDGGYNTPWIRVWIEYRPRG